MTTPTLTYKPGGVGHHVDLDRLVASRMLVQANSGGGKSRAIRQLLEETHGRIQHLVIDPEGEFATMRERFDYVLAAKTGGDTIAVPKYAARLCRYLVDVGASAVLDLYDLTLDERREYVQRFLTELMALPRSLWHPIIVVIDEMHVFAPEAGQSRAAEAVTALATQGRKRGFCLVGATQRISKLHKDVAAELLNKMIGRTGLDIDVKRAGDELGMGKDERAALKTLAPGEFFVYGPAISNQVTRVKTGAVTTSHPEAGRVGSAPPPPSDKIRAMLAQLADLPKEAEEEARTIEELKRANTQLRTQLTKAQKAHPAPRETEKVVQVVDERAIFRALDKQAAAISKANAQIAKAGKPAILAIERAAIALTEAVPGLHAMLDRLEVPVPVDPDFKPANGNGHVEQKPTPKTKPVEYRAPAPRPRVITSGASNLGKGEHIVLRAIAQYPEGADREQLSVLTGYKRSSRDTYIQRLQAFGYVEVMVGGIVATDAGIAALGDDFEPLPTGQALQEYWLNRLGGGEREILAILIDEAGGAVSRDELGESIGYKRSSRDTYLQRLQARKLVEAVGRGEVRASPILFEEAGR